MKNLIAFALAGMFFMLSYSAVAQYENKGFIFGGGFNFIDDSGSSGAKALNIDENWSSVFFPSRFSLGYVLTNGIFFQGFASYNQYREGTTVNGTSISSRLNYYALDGMVGYGLKNLIAPGGWFDPFVNSGMGVHRLAGENNITFNLGGGFNFWINESLAVNLSTLGKWNLSNGAEDNHIQHGIGIIYKPGTKNFLGKKKSENSTAQAKLIESTDESVDASLLASTSDEVAPANDREDNAIDKIQEKEQKAAAARKAFEERLIKDLSAIDRIAFEVNSSVLTQTDYNNLDQLISYLNYYFSVVIEIRGNVDPRGTEEYNAWLSVRRANRIRDYLISKGVAPERLKAVGSIENAGPCAEGKPCTEEELKESRRVEYILLKF